MKFREKADQIHRMLDQSEFLQAQKEKLQGKVENLMQPDRRQGPSRNR